MELEKMDIPLLEYFQSRNIYAGSYKSFNYKIFPGDSLRVVIWMGKFCLDQSEIIAEESFPIKTEEDGSDEFAQKGYENMLAWIYAMRKKLLSQD